MNPRLREKQIMNSQTIIIPILVPLLTSLVLALVGNRVALQRVISLLSCLGVTAYVFCLLYHVHISDEILTAALGGWQAPLGIVFVVDRLAAIMLCLSMGVGSIAM